MKLIFKLIDPSKGFLLGIELVDGTMVNELSKEEAEVSMFSLGLFILEITIVW